VEFIDLLKVFIYASAQFALP